MNRVLLIIFAAAASLLSSCRTPMTLQQLQQSITTELGKQPGSFAVAFKDLQTGQEFLFHEKETFHAASTMKVPVMIEIFKQAAAGKFSLTDSIAVKNEFRSIVDSSMYSLDPGDDSEKELYTRIGSKLPLSELVYKMIILSSNLATNIVIEWADAKKVTQTMRDLGANDIQVLRGVEDSKAFEKGLNNSTTAYDLMIILEKMADSQVVSPAASQAMINILLDQRFNEIIPARLPDTVKVAHKTGNITGVQHDAGIVFLPDGRRYVLVLLSKGLPDEKAGIQALAKVSEIVYQYTKAQ